MKVLLKHKDTHQFATRDGRWSSYESDATNFERPLDAINFCQLHRLDNTTLIVHEGNKQYEMPLRCDE